MEASLLGLTKSIHCSFDSFVFVMFCRGFPVRAHSGQSNFSFFQQKRKQEILLILIIFTYFTVQKKIEKKNGKENCLLYHFSNFEVRFKNTKKYC